MFGSKHQLLQICERKLLSVIEKRGLTSTDTDTIVNNLSGILSRANSRRAVSEAIKEVLVGTETPQVILFATELLSLVGAQHVGGAGLLQ